MAAKQAVEAALFQWGMPKRMRFDNGYPFANTSDRYVPNALNLWLVSIGIEVVFNAPHSPQQNGSVECTQRISYNWANPKSCKNPDCLQQALNHVSSDHINVLRRRRENDQTRAIQYPQINSNPKQYIPQNVDPQKVKDHLAGYCWEKEVYGNGRIGIFSKKWNIGRKYARQKVVISYDKTTNEWDVAMPNNKSIKRFKGPDLSKEAILNLAIFQ